MKSIIWLMKWWYLSKAGVAWKKIWCQNWQNEALRFGYVLVCQGTFTTSNLTREEAVALRPPSMAWVYCCYSPLSWSWKEECKGDYFIILLTVLSSIPGLFNANFFLEPNLTFWNLKHLSQFHLWTTAWLGCAIVLGVQVICLFQSGF